jgi:hypothetical protein
LVEAAGSETTKSRKIVFNSVEFYIDLFSNLLAAYITETGNFISPRPLEGPNFLTLI